MAKELFEFVSTKKSKVKLSYEPSGEVKVSDKKAFEGYLKKFIDYIEIDKKEKPRVLPEEKKPVKAIKPKVKPVEGIDEEDEEEEEEGGIKI